MVLFGGIARRLKYPALASVPVSAAMLSRVDSVSPEQHLDEVAQLFIAGRTVQVPVMDHGVAVGVVTRDSVTSALQSSGPDALVASAASRHVVTVAPSDALEEVLARLQATPDSVALVVDHGSPVGVVTADALVAYAATRDKLS
ncbi:MAG: CBS domain-containing protein [Deltaproteobacteria bacterium]|nr:CBS domain-containing protein [Deltaproteobacteria bacterium]